MRSLFPIAISCGTLLLTTRNDASFILGGANIPSQRASKFLGGQGGAAEAGSNLRALGAAEHAMFVL
jgi:hypothetical protein